MAKNELLELISRFNHSQNIQENSGNVHFSYAMGTLITQRINAPVPQAKKVTREVVELIDRLGKMMSFYDSTSQLSQINQKAGKSYILIDSELLLLIKESKKYARITEGVFNISIAALVDLWQYYGKLRQVPPNSLIKEKLPSVNYEDILIDEENRRVKLHQDGQKIDLGGIAKGYAANQIIQLYRQRGLTSGMINLGGNVALLGNRHDGKPWQVGIQNPRKERGKCLATVTVSGISVVTSGDYERFYLENNRFYHHILNPLTGYPANSGLISVTIIHPDSMLADVLSTTIFILGLEEGVKLLKRFSDIDVIIIHENGKIYISRSLVGQFQIVEKGYSLFKI